MGIQLRARSYGLLILAIAAHHLLYCTIAVKFNVNGYETTCFFEDLYDGFKFKTESFSHCTQVIMNKENLGEIRTVRLSEALKRPESHVRELYINDEGSMTDKSVSAVAEAIPASRALRVLALNKCGLTDRHVEIITRLGLQTPSRLESLILENNKIGPAGASYFARALMPPMVYASHLHSLQLHGNEIGNDGALTLSKLLNSSHTPVQHLDLSKNGIGPLGSIELKRAILQNKRLIRLGIEENKILGPFLRGNGQSQMRI